MNSVKLKWVYKVKTERRILGESECLEVERTREGEKEITIHKCVIERKYYHTFQK